MAALTTSASVTFESKIWSLPGAGRAWKTRKREQSFLRSPVIRKNDWGLETLSNLVDFGHRTPTKEARNTMSARLIWLS
jgi:hypothetical protein